MAQKLPREDRLIEAIETLPYMGSLLPLLSEWSHPVYLVGGSVRDLLLNLPLTDIDLVVEDDSAVTLAERVAESLGGEVSTHPRFMTASVALTDLRIDIATARSESYSRPGALPKVTPANLNDDLFRRDFTVNAMAVALSGSAHGELLKVPYAWEDLHSRRLRVLHRDSFLDDPTRLLRMVRYAARLDFALEDETQGLAHEAVAKNYLASISRSRLGAELLLLTQEHSAVAALGLAEKLQLLRAVHREWSFPHKLAETALELLPEDARRDLLLIGACLQGTAERELSRLLTELGLKTSETGKVEAVAQDCSGLAAHLQGAKRRSEVARLLCDLPLEQVAWLGALGAKDGVELYLQELRFVALDITGDDLLEVGFARGPELGRALTAAWLAKLDGKAETRQQQLATATKSRIGP